MDFSCPGREDGSPTKMTEVIMTVNDESNKTVGAAQEEYDPSQPLDSSDEEDCGLQFDNEVDCSEMVDPSQPSSIQTESDGLISTSVPSKDPEIDLSSIPMPSDEYRRPTIQFSIPTRHKLMSISSLIKRQKGVIKKPDRGGSINYSSEISKAFQKSDSSGDPQETADDGEEERPKISLVQEIFGSDDEEPCKDSEEIEGVQINERIDTSSQPFPDSIDMELKEVTNLGFLPFSEDTNARWKTVEETVTQDSPESSLKDNENCPVSVNSLVEGDENSVEEIRISIKPPSELMEISNNDEASSELGVPESLMMETVEHERGKENQQIILECVSEEDTDFEVTFVGIGTGRTLSVQRPRLGRQDPKKCIADKNITQRRKSMSPLNGFEEGEIVDQFDRKKKKAKKKKSKKRKRSKDSRVSSKLNSERSNSLEKKSFSENSDKEVSWRKPSKLTKTRNYRNGKRESEEKYSSERPSSKREDSSHKKGSPSRHTGPIEKDKSRSRRHRSLSGDRFRSRSRSKSRDSSARRNGRSRGTRRSNLSESRKSRSSISNHSSHSRSRSLSKKKAKRRHSPSPIRKHRNGRSGSRSPLHLSRSPRPSKRSKTNGTEASKRDKIRERSKSPTDSHPPKKSSKSKPEESAVEDSKKKGKKDKVSSEDLEKEKKKKRKRREKSLSPVKAIVADGDSIVVSLSFQKSKEEVSKASRVTVSSKSESISEKDKRNNNATDHSDDERRSGSSKPAPRKGTIMINLDSPMTPDNDFSTSPDVIVLNEDLRASKLHESKKGQEQKSDGKCSGSGFTQRTEGLDFVSSSHDCSADNTQTAVPDSNKVASSPVERTSASKSPYKFSEYFVSSTCDVGKSSSPLVENSPKHYVPAKVGESIETSLSQKVSDNPLLPPSETSRPGNSIENGPENSSSHSSPEAPHITHGKGSSVLSSKPMIGNIPGLFPSGFSTGPGGMSTTAPIIIPAPPRIAPSTNPSQHNLLNPNVLVSVASALYAPLLAAKHHNVNVSSGQAGTAGMSNISRNNQTNIFSKTPHSHNQALGLFNNRTNNGRPAEGDSPFSPNSSEGDDLFEPPGDGGIGTPTKKTQGDSSTSGTTTRSPAFKYPGDAGLIDKRSMFDTLFSTSPKKPVHSKYIKKIKSGHFKRSKQKRGNKRTEGDKNGEGEISVRLSEEVPTSAVALKIKEKFLKKLNRQERVVEEVKLSLKPHYSKKHITKEEYKDILRKAVPKICHNKSGEINPHKIKELVEKYVGKFRTARKAEHKKA